MKIFKKKKYSILSNILKYSFVFVFAFILIIPKVWALGGVESGPGGQVGGGPGGQVGSETGSANITGIKNTITNPLGKNIDSIPKFIEAVINIVLIVGIPIVVLAIIYTGFLFVKAQGNPEEISKAKNALMYTLIGAALLLGAFVIANAIGKTVDEIKSSA
ncbi:MAG: hypothetical protein NTU81_03700 [Candidatus Nomurabacteria bacterium]|nr:hypothetical protein [Candidatus Nomurabacteria bacterium]